LLGAKRRQGGRKIHPCQGDRQKVWLARGLSALDALQVGYLCLLEPNAKDAERGVQISNIGETFRPTTSVPITVNTGFDKAKANAVLASGNVDLVASALTHRSTSPIRPPSTASDPRATPITRCSPTPSPPNPGKSKYLRD
jgi:hypothetical protein